ncbi:MAG: VanZ family protein [Lachnospiraceae bacterium]|nr:VanZ family protein [Lachnospiraceae bacterium]
MIPGPTNFLILILVLLVLDGIAAIIITLAKKEVKRRTAQAIFISYIFLVLYITMFSRELGSRGIISLTLFETWGHSPEEHFNFISNIVLFLPMGFLVPFIWDRGFFATAGIGLLASLAIETVQGITRLGFPQIDDVMTNTMGAMIGWIVWKVWKMATREL